LAAPEIFNIDTQEDYEKFVRFLDEVNAAFQQVSRRVFVDLSPIKELGTSAALTFAATLDIWQRVKNRKLVARGSQTWRPEIRGMLVDIGMFDLPRTYNAPAPDKKKKKASSPTQMLKFCSGRNSDGSLARQLSNSMVEIAGPIDASQFLYAGLTEAMTNVCQHAYPEEDEVPIDIRRWWMTGSYDERAHRMRFVLLDLGVSIPKTLPRSGKWEQIRGLLPQQLVNDDAAMIEAAVEIGRSSIDRAGRGLGLDEVREFVENSHAGKLRILSRRGEVTYEKGIAKPVRRTLTTPFGGTLIEWEVFR